MIKLTQKIILYKVWDIWLGWLKHGFIFLDKIMD